MDTLAQNLCTYLRAPDSAYAESIRGLRASIMKQLASGRKCLLVTSSWPHEGKSTTCLSLAAALGEFGRRVLLVDGDLRRANLSAIFGHTENGLVDNHPPVPTSLPMVWLAPAGKLQGSAADVLAQPEIKNWLQRQRPNFDIILIDSPPLSACGDAILWGTQCDGALMVVSQAHFRGLPEGHFSEDLRDAGIEVLGLVLTGVYES